MSTIHVVGTGTPTPTIDRFGSCQVIDTGAELVMIDCGPASTDRLTRAGLPVTGISNVFLTHHHFDHTVDLPCLLLTRWDQSTPDTAPMRVYGPAGTRAFVDGIVGPAGLFRADLQARTRHPASQAVYSARGGTLPRPWPATAGEDLAPGTTVHGEDWKVTAVNAAHVQPYLDSIAYRIDLADASVVITGDTAYCEEVVTIANRADYLLCCCWDDDHGQEQVDVSVGQGMVGNMCGPVDAARIARDAGAKTLVLVHTTPSISHPDAQARAVQAAQDVFDGRVIFAYQGMTIRTE